MGIPLGSAIKVASAGSSAWMTYLAGYGAWVAKLSLVGKLGLAVGLVHPPAGLAVLAIATGFGGLAAPLIGRAMASRGRA